MGFSSLKAWGLRIAKGAGFKKAKVCAAVADGRRTPVRGFSQRYERGSTIVTSNLPFEDWTSVLGSERLTGALLDRLTHHVHILTMNGDSYRLKQSSARRRAVASADAAEQNQATDNIDTETGEITEA